MKTEAKISPVEKPLYLTTEEWITLANISSRKRLITFSLWMFGVVSAVWLAIFLFRTFGVAPCSNDDATFKWLGGVSVGLIGSLIVLVYKHMFKK